MVKELDVAKFGDVAQDLYREVVLTAQVYSSVSSAGVREVGIYTLVEQPVESFSGIYEVSDRPLIKA